MPQQSQWKEAEGNSHLAGRRSRLQPGPTAKDFVVPAGLVIESSNESCRFRGSAEAIAALREEFQKLERSPSGDEAHISGWTFRVQDESPGVMDENVIVLPWHAWGMVGALFSDVASGYEPNPFKFSDSGYIDRVAEDGTRQPWPIPDIGVLVEGPLLIGSPAT